jgi:hypothetical protein
MPSRRDLLQVSGAASLTALAGCSQAPFVPGPRLTVAFHNEIQREVEPILELIRADGDEYSEAVVFDESVSVPAPAERTDAPGRRVLTDIAPAQGYRARVWFGDTVGTPAADYRYYPDCASKPPDGDSVEPRLFIDLRRTDGGSATASVSQTRCSDDSLWY